MSILTTSFELEDQSFRFTFTILIHKTFIQESWRLNVITSLSISLYPNIFYAMLCNVSQLT